MYSMQPPREKAPSPLTPVHFIQPYAPPRQAPQAQPSLQPMHPPQGVYPQPMPAPPVMQPIQHIQPKHTRKSARKPKQGENLKLGVIIMAMLAWVAGLGGVLLGYVLKF